MVISQVYIKFILACMTSEKGAVLVLSGSKSKGGRKIGNLESCSQLLEGTRRIQDPVQFMCRKQNLKDNEQH